MSNGTRKADLVAAGCGSDGIEDGREKNKKIRKEWMICHAEIVQDPLVWDLELVGGLVFVPVMKNPVMPARLMGLAVGEAAVRVVAGVQVLDAALVAVGALVILVLQAGARLSPQHRRCRKRMKLAGWNRKLAG
jgi:hypothetical protein